MTTTGGTVNSTGAFTYVAPAVPTITSLSPTSGSTLGGTAITITGSILTGASSVTIGGVAATSVVVVDASHVTAVTPAGTAGAKDVEVITPLGTATKTNAFTYVAETSPTIVSVSPTSGFTFGGTAITITGTNLTGASSVTVGGAAATTVVVVSATSITAITPAGTAGAKDVKVITPAGTASALGAFTYVTPASPTISSLSPTSGSTLGGTEFTITGTNLTSTNSVTVGGVAATNVVVVSPTSVTAITPAGTAGAKDVALTTPLGTINKPNAFTYVAPTSTITSVSPTSGSTLGGTTITLTGTNLTGASSVTVGDAQATSVVVVSPTSVTAVTPAGTVGVKEITVTTPLGIASKSNAFIYLLPSPTLASVSPNFGSNLGATPITITGTNLLGATSVTVGGAEATSVVIVSSTTITALTPAGTVGAQDIRVRTPGGITTLAGGFTYVDATSPTITSVSPSSGTTLGGTTITISGTNLTGATSVKVGAVEVSTFSVLNSGTITATTPAGTVGAKNVVVIALGQTATAVNAFTYVAPAPTITSVSPSSGSTLGGTVITITGTNLTGASIVTVGGVEATSVVVVSDTSITAITPAGEAGAKSIAVTTPGGTATQTSAFTFVTPPPPTITSVSPAYGSTEGGTTITITGANLTGASSVTVGDAPVSYTHLTLPTKRIV